MNKKLMRTGMHKRIEEDVSMTCIVRTDTPIALQKPSSLIF